MESLTNVVSGIYIAGSRLWPGRHGAALCFPRTCNLEEAEEVRNGDMDTMQTPAGYVSGSGLRNSEAKGQPQQGVFSPPLEQEEFQAGGQDTLNSLSQ